MEMVEVEATKHRLYSMVHHGLQRVLSILKMDIHRHHGIHKPMVVELDIR